MQSRRFVAALVAVGLLAGSCSGGGGQPEAVTTTTQPAGVTQASRCVEAKPTEPELGELAGELELDTEVDVRTLDNGLTVYVRENDAPGGRGSLALVVRAGSLVEDFEHRGAAHFLEHMLFNGTERFPGNELVQELERFGSAIGPDLNAYTSYDETVYMLELPDVRRETRELAVDVLREWADRATLDDDEIEAEKGVIQEERRLRTESGDGRVSLQLEEFLLDGTPYEDANTIGTQESIDEMPREALLDFYESWYQPQNMAVVAVGDFDGDDLHELVEDRFADLDGGEVPEGSSPEVEPWDQPRYLGVVERELSSAFGSVGFTMAAPDVATGEGRRNAVLVEVAMAVVANRLSEAISRGDVPLSDASASVAFPLHGVLGPSVDFSAPSKDLRASVEAVVTEFEQVCRFGITDDELERVLAGWRAQVNDTFAAVDSKQDAHYAAELRSHYLIGAPVADPEVLHDLDLATLESITAEDVHAWFGATYSEMPPSIMVAGTSDDDVPSEEELASIAAAATDLELDDRADDGVAADALMEPPDAVEPASRSEIGALESTAFPAVVLEYDNGITVILQPTTISTGSFVIEGESPGGLSLLSDDEVGVAQVVASRDFGEVITQSGVGDLDQVALSRLLAGSNVEVSFAIEEELDTVSAAASSEEVETLFQLLHLYLTEPKVTEAALRTNIEQLRPIVDDPESLPQLALLQQLVEDRFPDEPRYRLLPSASALDTVDAEAAEAVVRDRFVEGGDFTFAIVGDLDLDEAEELASRYLGTLPAVEPEQWEDFMAQPPAAALRSTVRAGTGDQGGVAALYSTEAELDLTSRLAVAVAGSLIDTRLREVIREELGATYSPMVDVDIVDLPRGQIYALALVMGDPDGVDDVAAAIEAQIAALAGGGYSDDEFDRAVETVATDFELWDNDELAETHLEHARNPQWSYGDFVRRDLLVRRLERAEVDGLLAQVLDPNSLVLVQLVPAG